MAEVLGRWRFGSQGRGLWLEAGQGRGPGSGPTARRRPQHLGPPPPAGAPYHGSSLRGSRTPSASRVSSPRASHARQFRKRASGWRLSRPLLPSGRRVTARAAARGAQRRGGRRAWGSGVACREGPSPPCLRPPRSLSEGDPSRAALPFRQDCPSSPLPLRLPGRDAQTRATPKGRGFGHHVNETKAKTPPLSHTSAPEGLAVT